MDKKISDEEFNKRYLELIKAGYTLDSPELINLYKRKSYSQNIQKNVRVRARSKVDSQYNNQSNSTINNKKFHIIIDPLKGNYILLDRNLREIDKIHKNPLISFLTRKSNLKRFKKQLKKDYKAYKKYCKRNNIPIDCNFISLNKHIEYCLSLCPDADYQILELLRRNVQKVDLSYCNYQTACAQYLHELAIDSPYPSRMPFDLNYACNGIVNNHKNIANTFGYSKNPIDSFRKFYTNSYQSEHSSESKSFRFCTPTSDIIPPKRKFETAKHIKAPISYDER